MYCRLSYQIPFSETDAMAIVHHSNHAKYLERGRVEFLRLINLSYLELTKRGFHFPVTELNVRFRKPIVFDDIILVETKIFSLTRTRLSFSYKIFKGNALERSSLSAAAIEARELVSGFTEHCCVDNDGRPQPMDDALFEALQKNFIEEKK